VTVNKQGRDSDEGFLSWDWPAAAMPAGRDARAKDLYRVGRTRGFMVLEKAGVSR
jgi:hypothetical protein